MQVGEFTANPVIAATNLSSTLAGVLSELQTHEATLLTLRTRLVGPMAKPAAPQPQPSEPGFRGVLDEIAKVTVQCRSVASEIFELIGE